MITKRMMLTAVGVMMTIIRMMKMTAGRAPMMTAMRTIMMMRLRPYSRKKFQALPEKTTVTCHSQAHLLHKSSNCADDGLK